MDVRWTLEYQVGTYSGTITVRADENSDSEHVIALAKRRLYRDGHPGPVYERLAITHREGE